jgi:predicted tellurium resistance membrane protein TerC
VQTIVVADAFMGVENVVAGDVYSHGSMLVVLIGLGVSVPVVSWGWWLVLRRVERYPAILWAGAGVLGWTGAKMIASEPFVAAALQGQPVVRTLLYALIVAGLVAVPVSRTLHASQRLEVGVLVGVALWLAGFGWLDDVVSARIDRADVWHWDESVVDFVRWLGWIPLVIALSRRAAASRRARGMPH